MTKYMRKRLNDYRLARGLFWSGTLPAMPWTEIAVAVTCVLIYAVAYKYDTLNQRVIEMERDLPVYQSYRKVVLDVMNGDARFQLANGDMFECKGGAI